MRRKEEEKEEEEEEEEILNNKKSLLRRLKRKTMQFYKKKNYSTKYHTDNKIHERTVWMPSNKFKIFNKVGKISKKNTEVTQINKGRKV